MKTKTTKLWLATNTSWLPDYEAYVLCRTALESIQAGLLPGEILAPVKVKLTNCKWSCRGRASWSESEWVNGVRIRWQRILLRIGRPKRFPRNCTYRRYKDMPEYEYKTYREALVSLTAHEIGHVLGYSGRKAGEFKCEIGGIDALDYYREHQVEIDAEIERYKAMADQRLQRKEEKPTPEGKATAQFIKVKDLLAKWKRKQVLANNKVKKYTRALTRAQKRLPTLTGSIASLPPAEPLTPAEPSSRALAASAPPSSPGPALPGPAQ